MDHMKEIFDRTDNRVTACAGAVRLELHAGAKRSYFCGLTSSSSSRASAPLQPAVQTIDILTFGLLPQRIDRSSWLATWETIIGVGFGFFMRDAAPALPSDAWNDDSAFLLSQRDLYSDPGRAHFRRAIYYQEYGAHQHGYRIRRHCPWWKNRSESRESAWKPRSLARRMRQPAPLVSGGVCTGIGYLGVEPAVNGVTSAGRRGCREFGRRWATR